MEDNKKKCPFCGEEILAVAIKCKHCGEMLNKKPENGLKKNVRDFVLSISPDWKLRHEDETTIHFEYKRESSKASCCVAGCLLILLAWPIAILYAVLGGKRGKQGCVSIHFDDENITLSGDQSLCLQLFDMMRQDQLIGEKLVENDLIIKARKAKNLGKFLTVIFVILFIGYVIIRALQMS